ncbi:MAG: mechanosensitive ion channel, partial [Bacteroidales bacterium]|nr:mechanosensitive ion channel [Bacteroidales bacterium]
MKRIALFAIIICFGTSPTQAETSADTIVHIAYSPIDSIQIADTTGINRLSAKSIENQLQMPTEVFDAISFSKIFWTLILLIFGYLIVRLIITLLEVLGERTSKHRIRVKSLIPIVRIAIWGIVIFAIIQGIYNPPLQTLIAMGASITIAVGLAAQDLLKNVFGGIMLLFDRPFQVGDKIEAGQ